LETQKAIMKTAKLNRMVPALACGACLLAASAAVGAPLNVTLYAKQGYLNPTTGAMSPAPGAGLIPMWGFATTTSGTPQVPGPLIEVAPNNIADGLAITVSNQLSVPISLVIPGLNGSAAPGNPVKFDAGNPDYANRVRSLVPEVPPLGSRVYTWTGPLKLGTYVYHSGTHPAVQVQMGLYGMVTVVTNGPTAPQRQVYPGVVVNNNRQVPVIFSEIDSDLHAAVAAGNFGPGLAISSTIRSDPNYFLINGQAYSTATPPGVLTTPGQVGQTTLFRMINVCWDTRIPVLGGPFPSAGGKHLTAIAEDANLYPYPRTAYAPELPAMKTMDFLFTPTQSGTGNASYRLYDRRLGLANATEPNGGMLRTWNVSP
jgi:FtsP/CotA-like multicopper oxidase with cupredoxin domain